MTTNRGDMPAMPLTGDAYTDYAGYLNSGMGYEPECQGLTIREQFAMAAMQGLLSNHRMVASCGCYDEVSLEAVKHADALLAELERTK